MKTKMKMKMGNCDACGRRKVINVNGHCERCAAFRMSDTMRRKIKVVAKNLDTARKVQEVLAQLNTKAFTVIGYVPSDTTEGKMYEIRLLASNAVICNCKGWQYSKTGTCKHLEHFRSNVKPSVFPGPVKTK